ncbi:MAG: YkgJ family cysteine cluster protein [Bacteroidales bacterium]|nr:YkgJ family cysteine cluster protein [Clostridium sp.]MCM1204556.1 YkgJ family cysteine cluster protein [Bacteroidales bacterium]
MKRNMDMSEVSDGKLYGINDMVKAGCDGCKGCSACCRGMGNSIVLDPFDVYRLTNGLNCRFEDLLADKLDLQVVDGIILPNLKMAEDNGECVFLNEEGRCSIHELRPGICRIFPLGRIYENGSFRYFLQVNECKKQIRTKVKVKKWIDVPDYAKNEEFINRWHYFLKGIGEGLPDLPEEKVKQINIYILNAFFITLYEERRDFYEQFEERVRAAEKICQQQVKFV